VLAQGEDIIPIPGTKKRKYLEDNVGAIEVELTSDDLTAVDELIKRYPITGERYSEGAMKMVNH
jgi:aryl-alcohol dehydrogenase-like predicted oxidoreductase